MVKSLFDIDNNPIKKNLLILDDDPRKQAAI